MFNFSDRPAKCEPKHLIGGERPASVFEIGRHTVTVYVDGEVTMHQPRGYRGDPRDTLPNMEIVDGQVRIAMEDLIDQILARIEPEELAVSLWKSDEVKDRFMEALSERWTQDNVGDKDRRKFLDKVKEQIHDIALDKLAAAMASMEYKMAQGWSCYREIDDANARLQNWDVRKPDGELLRLNCPTNVGEFSIGGGAWNEARDHWRHEVRAMLSWEPSE